MEDVLILQAYKNLACEIVRQTIKDYKRTYIKCVKSRFRNKEDEAKLKYLRYCFRSEWFAILCDVEPERLIKSIEALCYKKLGFKNI